MSSTSAFTAHLPSVTARAPAPSAATAPLASYRKHVPHPAVGPVMALLGGGLLVAGVSLAGGPAARTGVLCGLGALLLLAGGVLFVDGKRKRARDERILLHADQIEVVTSAGSTTHRLVDLRALRGKVIHVQQTGARLHAYQLEFTGATLELVAGDLVGVDASTGALLERHGGVALTPWT
jgi:hypothetical protein